ncbi:hypothetical protein [Numidum massiliense]|uniref:hypothetical protein n=1 Tax=Numidum massiliense TaxID=1522315 RepID=UPI0006D5B09C|nr:hypothetical protein [Numidum massiliense]
METLKLSEIVKAMAPDLYALLTEEELDADVVIHGEVGTLAREDVNRIIASAIEQNLQTPLC